MNRLLDGVPADLRVSVSARGETVRGDVAEHALGFGLLDGQPVPIISGAFWFDGSTWHTSRGLLEIGHRDGFGMDDYGFGSAVRQPYRLGGTFTLDDVAPPDDAARRRQLEQLFEACPYAEQPRPEGDVRLGYAIPSSTDREGIVDAVERATAAWWHQDPAEKRLGDDTFTIGGHRLSRAGDPSVLTAVVGLAEPWTVDALQGWTDGLVQAMARRWGPPQQMQVADAQTGVERRTPLTRLMRGTGLTHGPLWWVNGQGVLLLAGMTDPSYSTEPQAILAICRADTVLELLGRTSIWETRLRARVIDNIAALVAESGGHVDTAQHAAAKQPVVWDGPTLRGSALVPRATRGGLRAGTFFWVWHFTHDGRGLLTSHQIGGKPGDFAEQLALYEGVPEDLLSLVVDAEPAGPYPVVTRDGEAGTDGALGRARSLPDAVAVFFYDGHDWRAPEGMLRKAHAASIENDVDPLAALYSATTGVRQLQWALRGGQSMSVSTLADPQYGSAAFSRAVSPEEVRAAFGRLATPLAAALQGSLNDLLDVIVDGPGYRGLLDAALSNVEPQRRQEIALWLLGEGVDASTQLSFMTPVNVLLANPSLEPGDAVILRQLLESGADPGFGLLGARPGGHPLVQLCDRDVDGAELEPFLDVLLEADEDGAVARYDVTAPLLPDGRSLLEYVRDGRFPHQRSRAGLLDRLERLASRSVCPDQR